MEYKTDWKLDDTVMPEDLNRIEGNIRGLTETGADMGQSIEQMQSSLEGVTGRGYTEVKEIASGSANDIAYNGKYKVNGTNVTNMPTNDDWYMLDVTAAEDGSYVTQYASAWNGNKVFVRHKNPQAGGWQLWEEIAALNSVLPKSGGNLTGMLTISTEADPMLHLNAKVGGGTLWKSSNGTQEYGTCIQDIDGAGNTALLNLIARSGLESTLLLNYRGAIYPVYHTGNITVSQAAPTTALIHGGMHNVY